MGDKKSLTPNPSTMNRTPTPKSFKSDETRNTQLHQEMDPQRHGRARQSDKALLARLDDCSVEELEQLRRRQCKINDRFAQEDAQELCALVRDRPNRPLQLQSEQEKNPLDVALLFSQFTGEKLLPIVKKQTLLTHNFSDSESLRALYGWTAFQSILQPFFRPVHYEVYVKLTSKPYTLPLNERSQVQNALIHSHFNPYTIKCLDLVLPLESMLNAVLGRVILHDTRVLLVMEWNENQTFWLIVGFRVHYALEMDTSGAKTTLEALKQEALQLCRQDLVDESVGEMADFETEQQVKLDLGWLRRALRQGTLSYMYCAYAKRQQ